MVSDRLTVKIEWCHQHSQCHAGDVDDDASGVISQCHASEVDDDTSRSVMQVILMMMPVVSSAKRHASDVDDDDASGVISLATVLQALMMMSVVSSVLAVSCK